MHVKYLGEALLKLPFREEYRSTIYPTGVLYNIYIYYIIYIILRGSHLPTHGGQHSMGMRPSLSTR